MLNERQLEIIKLLRKKKTWVRGRNLSMLLNVSDRTIRSDIEKINDEYQGTIVSSFQNGYKFGNEIKGENKEIPLLPQSSEERGVYIIQQLLFNHREIGIDHLMNNLYISEFTLENDLKRLKTNLKKYGDLQLVRSKKFIMLMGSEEEKRKLYKNLLDKETKGNFLNLNTLAALYQNFDLLKVKDLLDEVLRTYAFEISEIAIPMLMMHIGIALERIMQKNYIFLEYETNEIIESQEYTIAKAFFEAIEKEMQIHVVNEEIIQLSLLLLGKKSLSLTKKGNMDDSIDDRLILTILTELKNNFDVDFTKDEELLVGLAIHIRSLLYRTKNKLRPHNVFLVEIKRKYPLVFDMGVQVCNLLEKEKTIKIDENEIGYIALHLGAAYERNLCESKYHAVLIVPHEASFSQTCQSRILSKFFERMDIVACFSMIDEKKIMELQPDFMILTSTIEHKMNLPVVQISILFNLEDESILFQTLNRMDKQKFHSAIRNEIQSFMNPKYFYSNMQCTTPEEVIHFMCEKLRQDNKIGDDFEASVLKRESISATSFFYSFATPHALYTSALQSNISIMILEKPILWGGFQVRLVLLLALQNQDKKLLKLIFGWLSQMINDVEGFTQILESKSYDEFMKCFIDFEYLH